MIRQSVVGRVAMLVAMQVVLLGAPAPLEGQDFTPPQNEEGSEGGGSFNLGLYGFSTRLGLDFEDEAKPLLSVGLDLGDLFSSRLRLRPSAEIGFGETQDTYVVNAEIMYRFTADSEAAVPYIGAGLGIATQDGCNVAPNCPEAWLQFALGFEIRIRESLNWLLEYHGEDALERHRLFVGLSTRRGG